MDLSEILRKFFAKMKAEKGQELLQVHWLELPAVKEQPFFPYYLIEVNFFDLVLCIDNK